MKKKIDFSTLLKIIIYFKFLPSIIIKIKNWPTFLMYYIGIKDGKFECIFRDGVKIMMDDNIGAATIAVIFIKKDYGSVNENSIVIDIGANIGVYSIFSALKNNKVYAFEPMADNFRLLEINVKNNNLSKKIFPYKLAVAGKKEKRDLYLGESPFHSLYSIDESPFNALYENKMGIKQNHASIECMSLADIFLENEIDKCDMLKIDCEGAEYEILYNLPEEYFKKIKEIRMEYHNHISDERDTGVSLRKFLEEKNFTVIKDKRASDFQGDLWLKNNI